MHRVLDDIEHVEFLRRWLAAIRGFLLQSRGLVVLIHGLVTLVVLHVAAPLTLRCVRYDNCMYAYADEHALHNLLVTFDKQ